MTTLNQICDTIVCWLNEPEPHDPNWPPETWQSFKTVCRVHGIAPLLRAKLEHGDWPGTDLQQWLDEQYTFNSRRIALMQSELQAILARFAAHSIDLIPLKGSLLTAHYYQDPALRPMADLDLLIRPDDFSAAATLLAELGYEQDVVHWKHTEFVNPNNRHVVSPDCEHPDNPRGLEIHRYCRETFGGPSVELTRIIWGNAVRATVVGEQALVPTPEALWLHLLVHHTYHLWQGKGRLIQLVDLALLAPNLDDLQLLDAVDGRFTLPSLLLLKRCFPEALPDAWLAAQQSRVSASFQTWAASLDLINTSYLGSEPAGLYLLKALKFSEGRPSEVIRALRFAFLPSLNEIALDHPRLARSNVPWLAYALLPLDWVRRLLTR